MAEGRRLALWLASQPRFLRGAERARRARSRPSSRTNLAKHARRRRAALPAPLTAPTATPRASRSSRSTRGPGIPDVARSQRDGYSTAGTLGHGLGAIERQADSLDIYTQPTGTVIAARLWRERPRAERQPATRLRGRRRPRRRRPARTSAAMTGRGAMRDWRLAIFVADGLGHGLHGARGGDRRDSAVFASRTRARAGTR